MKEARKGPLEALTETNQLRIEEEETRPRVEEYLDDFSSWVAAHEAAKRGVEFTFWGVGWR